MVRICSPLTTARYCNVAPRPRLQSTRAAPTRMHTYHLSLQPLNPTRPRTQAMAKFPVVNKAAPALAGTADNNKTTPALAGTEAKVRGMHELCARKKTSSASGVAPPFPSWPFRSCALSSLTEVGCMHGRS